MKMLILILALVGTAEAATVRGMALRDLSAATESQSLLLPVPRLTVSDAPEATEPPMTVGTVDLPTTEADADAQTVTEAAPTLSTEDAPLETLDTPTADTLPEVAVPVDLAAPVDASATDVPEQEASPKPAMSEAEAPRVQVTNEALINIGAASVLPQDTSSWADRGPVFSGLKTGLFAILTLITACILFDGLAYLLHKTKFQACKQQIQRVGDMFQHSKTNLQLCPYCVEDLTGCSSDKVTFLCGHRFHTKCANEGFRQDPVSSGRCPVCFGSKADDKVSGCEASLVSEDLAKDQAQTYVLQSLHRLYPKIILEECVKRWTPCHTEIWLSELTCPRYNSIFKVFRSVGRS